MSRFRGYIVLCRQRWIGANHHRPQRLEAFNSHGPIAFRTVLRGLSLRANNTADARRFLPALVLVLILSGGYGSGGGGGGEGPSSQPASPPTPVDTVSTVFSGVQDTTFERGEAVSIRCEGVSVADNVDGQRRSWIQQRVGRPCIGSRCPPVRRFRTPTWRYPSLPRPTCRASRRVHPCQCSEAAINTCVLQGHW